MKYGTTVRDDVGREHPRKHLRYKERGELEAARLQATGDEKRAIDRKLREQPVQDHPYEKALREAKEKEKVFLSGRRARRETYLSTLRDTDRRVRKWAAMQNESEKCRDFYAPLVDLSYDFELAYEENRVLARELPAVIENRRELLSELEKAQKDLARAKKEDRADALAAYKADKKALKEAAAKEKDRLTQQYRNKMISATALRNEKKRVDLSVEEDLSTKKRLLPVTKERDRVRHLRHQLKIEAKSRWRVIQMEISDLRRKTPIEIGKRFPWLSVLTCPIPGLGQLLLGQVQKAFFFFLGSLFIYFVAIPYAQGQGNYRGQGIAGLISLAEGAGALTARSSS